MKDSLAASLTTALEELRPSELVRPHLPAEEPALILAVGKAALSMLSAARAEFPSVPWIATPPRNPASASRAVVHQDGLGLIAAGSHPLPDEHSVAAANLALERTGSQAADDSVLLLVSGGGSALWCAPHGVTLQEKRLVVDQLLRSGADIFELNAVRKNLSRIKGGRLAAQVKGRILSLVISDVPGDNLSVVASGVAFPGTESFADALAVLDKYQIPAPAARSHLERGTRGEVPASPSVSDPVWQRVENRLIGSNRQLLMAAKRYWETQGYPVVVVSDRFQGEARDVAQAHAIAIRHLRAGGRFEELPRLMNSGHLLLAMSPGALNSEGAVVLVSGGETTVNVKGSGRGGRNQEFALWLLHFLGHDGVWAISAGSDGIDGNSDAAGAILRPDSFMRASALGLDSGDFLARNDSYSFFEAIGDRVMTGPSGNNLNDYRAVMVPRGSGKA